MLKQENITERYKYVVKATCIKHIADSINQLKIMKSHISGLQSVNSWYLLMEHHINECELLKQTQENDRLSLIRLFDLDSLVECAKIDHVIKLTNLFKTKVNENYGEAIDNCIHSICISDTYRAVLGLDTD
jgi:hypothetical protein